MNTVTNTKTTNKPRNNSPYKRRDNQGNRGKHNSGYIDPLVMEALDFINKQQDNNTVFGCFHKRNGRLETFGVYNSLTKKHSLHYVNNFFSKDFMDVKVVALAR